MRFQNGYNKVVIELCNFGLKSYFWFQIALTRSHAQSRAVTRMISDQIVLHSSSITIIKFYIGSN